MDSILIEQVQAEIARLDAHLPTIPSDCEAAAIYRKLRLELENLIQTAKDHNHGT